MSETFNTNVEINGSSDTTQLKVNAHSSQTAPLQSWNTSSGDQVARTETDGRFQTGSLNTGAGATGDAQIEVFRHEDAIALPVRGLNITGAIKDALTGIVSWSVHELFLKGSAGVRALHSALRVRIVNQNTGTTNTGAELRAGEFELFNAGGASGNPIPVASGLDVRVTNENSGHIGTAHGLRVEVDDLNTNGIADAYAIHATGAKTRLDDVLELHGDRASAPTAENQVAKIYVKSDGKLYARIGSGAEYILSIAPIPVDNAKFLRGDGTWAATGSGNGTVTSVALSATPTSIFNVSGSPVVTSGTLALSMDNQAANTVLTGPASGGATTPAFRSLINADIAGLDPRIVVGPINTSDATPTTIYTTTALSTTSSLMIEGFVTARRGATVGQGLIARFAATFSRGSTSDITLVGSFVNVQHNSGNAPDVTLAVNTMNQTGLLRVAGVAGQQWYWKAVFSVTYNP